MNTKAINLRSLTIAFCALCLLLLTQISVRANYWDGNLQSSKTVGGYPAISVGGYEPLNVGSGLVLATSTATITTIFDTSQVTLHGTISQMTDELSADCGFEWGYAADNLSTTVSAGTVFTPGIFSASIGTINPNRIFYYRFFATESTGTVYGAIMTGSVPINSANVWHVLVPWVPILLLVIVLVGVVGSLVVIARGALAEGRINSKSFLFIASIGVLITVVIIIAGLLFTLGSNL